MSWRKGLIAAAALPGLAHAEPPKLQQLRYDEDWRASCVQDAGQALKCIGDPAATMLSLGGELRERIETVSNPSFDVAHPSDRVFLHRALLHADLRIGPSVRAFVQLAYLDQSGRRIGPVASDTDRLDLAQGFVDVSTRLGGADITVRGGRQEIALGSSRLVAVRDGTNARRTFDGARAFVRTARTRLDLLYLKPVDTRPGTFDDSAAKTDALYGGYLVRQLGKAASLDLYVLWNRKALARYAGVSGREMRTSFGARFAGHAQGLDWNVEGVVQHGSLAGRPIRAWTLASDTGYRIDAPLNARLGLKVDVASGNHAGAQRGFGTFNALYPRLPYFSEAGLLVPANLIDLHPQIELRPAKRLGLVLGADWAWRETTRDAVYLFPLTPLTGSAGAPGRFTGRQFITEASLDLMHGVLVTASYVHFAPGAAVRAAGGQAGDFGMFSIDWKW